MCELITFAVPQRVVIPDVPGGRDAAFGVAPYKNSGGGHSYPAGSAAYSLTVGGCSCSLYLEPQYVEARARGEAQLEARFRSKGWSEAKVARALQDHRASTVRKARPAGFVTPVLAYFASVLEISPVLHFIVHHHHAGFTDERFALIGTVALTERELAAGVPCPEPDHFYSVRREAA